MGVPHLCGCGGSQPRPGENHSGSGILLSPGISRVHPYTGKWDQWAKNLSQGGLWCKESGRAPIKEGENRERVDGKMSTVLLVTLWEEGERRALVLAEYSKKSYDLCC